MMALKPQMRLKLKADGRTGTTVPTHSMLLSDGDGPISLVFDGTEGGETIAEPGFVGVHDIEDFEFLGDENAVVDDACGLGKGAACCVYATIGDGRFQCDRYTALGRNNLRFARDMGAQRKPVAAYPFCKVVVGGERK